MGDSESDNSNDTAVILYVVDTSSRPRWNYMIEAALCAEGARRRIHYRCIEATSAEDAADLALRLSADAVIAPSKYRPRLTERLRPRRPVFDFDWLPQMLGKDNDRLAGRWVDTGGKYGWFNSDGKFGMGGFDGADRFGWNDAQKIFNGFARLFGGQVVGVRPFLGGRVGTDPGTAAILGLGIAGSAIVYVLAKCFEMNIQQIQDIKASALRDINRAIDDIEEAWQEAAIDEGLKYQVKTEPLPDHEEEHEQEQEEGGTKPESATQEGLDDGGSDFLLVMKQFWEEAMLSELWHEIVEGRVPPERTDRRDEFLYWLRQRDLIDAQTLERVLAGMPTPKDDESLFALRYWLWTQYGQRRIDSKVLEYLITKGAPIDPARRGHTSAGKVFALEGNYDGRGRMKLHFNP